MEYGLKPHMDADTANFFISLNPYCNGTCSRRCNMIANYLERGCLNPYCNGTCSRRGKAGIGKENRASLNPYCNGTCSRSVFFSVLEAKAAARLNPYCNGTCSRSGHETVERISTHVLILIVMEHALGASGNLSKTKTIQS